MGTNTPNISEDTFEDAKNFRKVTLQQGVPIVDSDWNELQDIGRMELYRSLGRLFGDARLPAMTNGSGPGLQIQQATSTSQNFKVTAGSALLGGRLIKGVSSGVSADRDYILETTNFLCVGVTSAAAGGNLSDENKLWESWHDLVDCRVLMTSGAESGNYFDITVLVDSTTVTLSGGTGSIGIGDTYKILPPVLTTPSGDRTDSVYLMCWFADINNDEDPDLVNAGLGMAPSTRQKLHSVVRVNEGGSYLGYSHADHFDRWYIPMGTLDRLDGDATITTAMISNVDNGISSRGIWKGHGVESGKLRLAWRSPNDLVNWNADATVGNTTVSHYIGQAIHLTLTNAYIRESDGHVINGGSGSVSMFMQTPTQITQGNAHGDSAGTDYGAYDDLATWDDGYTQKYPEGYAFGVESYFYQNAHLDGPAFIELDDSGSVLRPWARADTGWRPAMYYTGSHFFYLINAGYDESTQLFSHLEAATSYMFKFGHASIVQYRRTYQVGITWNLGEWESIGEFGFDQTMTNELVLRQELAEYTVDAEDSIAMLTGHLHVLLRHPTQGDQAAIYRIGAGDFTLVSGNDTYFTVGNGVPNKLNIRESGSNVIFQNKVTVTVEVGYSWVRPLGISP